MVTRLLGLPELPNHGKTGKDQASVILPLLTRFSISSKNLGWFVLNNATNNDTILEELAIPLEFKPEERRLRCMGYIINLIAEAYLFGQDANSFSNDFKKAGKPERRKLWRSRGELGKLYNLVVHVIASGKRTDLFKTLQGDLNTGVAEGKVWKLILDGGIRWNALYSMIRRALELREALDTYAAKLRVSTEEYDVETFDYDYLSPLKWKTLSVIKEQLEPLFLLTKSLEGNTKLDESGGKPSHGALWECLPVLKHILGYLEGLEIKAKAGEFNHNPRIQSSITLAWNKTEEYYRKTDASIAWIASMVLYPRWK